MGIGNTFTLPRRAVHYCQGYFFVRQGDCQESTTATAEKKNDNRALTHAA